MQGTTIRMSLKYLIEVKSLVTIFQYLCIDDYGHKYCFQCFYSYVFVIESCLNGIFFKLLMISVVFSLTHNL